MMVSASPKYWPGSRASSEARSTMAAMPMAISVAAVMYHPSGERGAWVAVRRLRAAGSTATAPGRGWRDRRRRDGGRLALGPAAAAQQEDADHHSTRIPNAGVKVLSVQSDRKDHGEQEGSRHDGDQHDRSPTGSAAVPARAAIGRGLRRGSAARRSDTAGGRRHQRRPVRRRWRGPGPDRCSGSRRSRRRRRRSRGWKRGGAAGEGSGWPAVARSSCADGGRSLDACLSGTSPGRP